MRIYAVALAALGLAIALPASAATLSDATVSKAGITPDSPLSFFDKTLDAITIALALTAEAKVDASLAVSEERAAEAAVMIEAGNVAKTTEAIAAVQHDLQIAVTAAAKITAPEDSAPIIAKMEASVSASQSMLLEGLDAAPAETAAELQIVVAPALTVLAAAPNVVSQTVATAAGPQLNTCEPRVFEGCVRDNGCTQDTSETCFRACPSKPATCANPASGKTCSVPDTACVNACLVKLSGCFDTCLTTSHCKKDEVSTSTLQLLAPEELQRVFQLQLQNTTVK